MVSPNFQVGPDTVVHFSYALYDAEGELVEDSGEQELSFLFGYGQLAPSLEAPLLGMAVGETKTVELPPQDAFGERDPEAIIEVDREDFPEQLAPGDEFSAESDEGVPVTLLVLEVDEARVVLDTNHPLAGQRVRLMLTVEAVRPAKADEITDAAELLESGQTPATSLLPAAGLLRRSSTARVEAAGELNPSPGGD